MNQTFNVTVKYTASRYCSKQHPNGYTKTHKSVTRRAIDGYRRNGNILDVVSTTPSK
jgi:hypothetical protein